MGTGGGMTAGGIPGIPGAASGGGRGIVIAGAVIAIAGAAGAAIIGGIVWTTGTGGAIAGAGTGIAGTLMMPGAAAIGVAAPTFTTFAGSLSETSPSGGHSSPRLSFCLTLSRQVTWEHAGSLR